MSQATKLWRDQEASEEGTREARAALNSFSKDMRGLLVSSNTNWFYSGTNQLAFLSSLPTTAQSSALDRSDICAIGYSLEWGKANPGDPAEKNRWALYRYVRFSDPTHTSIIVPTNQVAAIFDSPDNINTIRELLARNVTRVAYDLYSTNSTGQPVPYVSSSAVPAIVDFSISTINERAADQLGSQSAWQDTNSLIVRQNEQTFNLRVRILKP